MRRLRASRSAGRDAVNQQVIERQGRDVLAASAPGGTSRSASSARRPRRRGGAGMDGGAVHRSSHAHARAVHAGPDVVRDLVQPLLDQTRRGQELCGSGELRHGPAFRAVLVGRGSRPGVRCHPGPGHACPCVRIRGTFRCRGRAGQQVLPHRVLHAICRSGRCCIGDVVVPAAPAFRPVRATPVHHRAGECELLLRQSDSAHDHPHRRLGVDGVQHDHSLHVAAVHPTGGDGGRAGRRGVAAAESSCASNCPW